MMDGLQHEPSRGKGNGNGNKAVILIPVVLIAGAWLTSSLVQLQESQSRHIPNRMPALFKSKLRISKNTNTDTTIPQIFGHLHYGKTAGTELIGQMTSQFERVCGNKGYSYDAYKFNERYQNTPNASIHHASIKADLIEKRYPNHNRGVVPFPVMKEIGWEDCDYISFEEKWSTWETIRVAGQQPRIELHVPCRDPMEHFLSACNYHKVPLPCLDNDNVNNPVSDATWKRTIRQCQADPKRLSLKLNGQTEGTRLMSLKCFEFFRIPEYMDYMSAFLDRKKYPFERAYRDPSAHTRNKSLETCLLQDEARTAWLRQELYDTFLYYRYCDKCIGSPDDLLAV